MQSCKKQNRCNNCKYVYIQPINLSIKKYSCILEMPRPVWDLYNLDIDYEQKYGGLLFRWYNTLETKKVSPHEICNDYKPIKN